MRFDLIYADPPWTFSVWNAAKSDRHASHKYDLMGVDEICTLPVGDICSENCALFIWATWPNIKDALKVIEAWGFTYRTQAFTWAKVNRMGFANLMKLTRDPKGWADIHNFLLVNLWFMGMGYYTRANTEPVLLGIRGTMPVASRGVRSLIIAPVGRHSAKPPEVYTRIEKLYPDAAKVELFARQTRPGWVSLGNEVNAGQDIRDTLPALARCDQCPATLQFD